MYVGGIIAENVRTQAEGPERQLGSRGSNQTTAGPKEYVYVQADGGGVTAAGYVVAYSMGFVAAMVTTANTAGGTGQGKPVGIAQAAIPANGYGWVLVDGAFAAGRVSASCAAYTQLNTTATAGQLDDDATAASRVIEGIVLNVANGGAAGVVAGICRYPVVGRTL